MRAARMACTVAGTWISGSARASRWAPRSPSEDPGLDQGADALLQKEGIPLGPLDQDRFDPRRAGVVAEEAIEQLAGARRRQRVETELGVVGLAAPAMLVLGAIVDQQEDAGARETLHQAVEERLRLAIDPVKVLEDEEQRLHLALTEQQALDGLERSLAALRGIEGLPAELFHGDVEQGEEGRQGRPEGGSRVRSLPVTFSRIFRLSSRPSMSKYPLRRSMTGR